MPTISVRWPGAGQIQQQEAWCWAAATATLIDCFGGGARSQAQIVHEWLMSDSAEADEIVNNYRAWIDSFQVLIPTWENVRAQVEANPPATELMNLANGNTLPGVAMEFTDLSGQTVAAIAGLIEGGGLYVLGSAYHWYILYGADIETGELLVWDPNVGAVTREADWLANLAAYQVTGYAAP